MAPFSFLNPDRSIEKHIQQLPEISVFEERETRSVSVGENVSMSSIRALLRLFRKLHLSFSLYDPLYPSPSDPGAHLAYSQEKNRQKNAWSMTLGNHGWSGGIYTIHEDLVAEQLYHLARKKMLEPMRIGTVASFSHYTLQEGDAHHKQNALLQRIHSKKNIPVRSLVFGLFDSESRGKNPLFKLTDTHLYIDNSNSWASKRVTREGYTFQGKELPRAKFETAWALLTQVPGELLTDHWNGFHSTDNKNEPDLVLEIVTDYFTRTISLNRYKTQTEHLSENVQLFRHAVEALLKQL